MMKNAEDKEKVSEMEADAETASFSNRITSVVSRLTEIESLVKAFDGCAGVFHTAAFVDPAGISGYSVRFNIIHLMHKAHLCISSAFCLHVCVYTHSSHGMYMTYYVLI